MYNLETFRIRNLEMGLNGFKYLILYNCSSKRWKLHSMLLKKHGFDGVENRQNKYKYVLRKIYLRIIYYIIQFKF